MQKHFLLSLMIVLTLISSLMTGCESEKSVNPGVSNYPGVESIELRVSNTQIRGFSGDLRTEQITAIARDVQGVAVSEAKITFGIIDPKAWKGTILAPTAEVLTDENGQLIATYSVSIEQTSTVVIEARCGQITSQIELNVIVANDVIGSLTLEATQRVLAVPPNQTRTTEITASLVDVDGNALPGMEIKFRTDPPGLGFVDGETASTDFNGRASRSFSSIVNKYGTCEITAMVGDYEGTALIEILPVAAPAFVNLTTSTPIVKVSEGQNATISLEAVVTDQNRVGVPETKIAFEVSPYAEDGATFGSLSAPDTTDGEGRAVANFNSLGEFGKLRVLVRVLPSQLDGLATEAQPDAPAGENLLKQLAAGTDEADAAEIIAELVIEIQPLSIGIGSLSIRALPSFLKLAPDANGQSSIRAQVRDRNNNGIPNVRVDFVTDLGTLSQVTQTDDFGVASAVFHNNYEAGVALITASVPGTNFQATALITIEQSEDATGNLSLSTDKDFIYADDGLTTALLTALLSDAEGQALSGLEIIFTKTHGTVNSPVITDSLGIARALFRDVGIPSRDEFGNIIPAVITARYDALGLVEQVEITILERNPASRITLQSGAEQMTAGSDDTTPIRATCFLENGNYAPEGTLVRFEVDFGQFSVDAAAVTGNYGVAETEYTPGSITGTAHLTANVENSDHEIITSNEVLIQLLPGLPSRVTVSASPDQLITNDPNSFSTITATVLDTVNNPVMQGTMVRFATSLGNITQTAITDESGHAQARLSAGVEAGLAEITATVNVSGGTISGNTTVSFISGSPNSIELSANPLQIAVAGTGANSTSTIQVEVRDANGNLVEESIPVYFELLNEPPEPQGCNLNNHGQADLAMTSSGLAMVSLNAGLQTGGKMIRAYTWRDEEQQDLVEVTISTIAVISGPPFSLDIDLNDHGEDADGGAWRVQVSARVFDIHHNPVANQIPVVFTVEPEIASISAGYTGNEGWGRQAEPGLAYATLTYQSAVTFSPIRISARVATPDGFISGLKDHVLPLQEGVLELHMDPGNWMFERNDPEALCNVRVWVVLKDGHQALINNAPILFTSELGMFSWYNFRTNSYVQYYPETVRKYTGVVSEIHNESTGHASVFLRGTIRDFFLNDQDVNASVQIEARVEGYDDVSADPSILMVHRR